MKKSKTFSRYGEDFWRRHLSKFTFNKLRWLLLASVKNKLIFTQFETAYASNLTSSYKYLSLLFAINQAQYDMNAYIILFK